MSYIIINDSFLFQIKFISNNKNQSIFPTMFLNKIKPFRDKVECFLIGEIKHDECSLAIS